MALIYVDGFESASDDGVSEWSSAHKRGFTDVLSFICVKCHCRTTIGVPKGEMTTIGDVVCPLCKQVLMLTTFTAHAE
jgi:hypothetical protein